MSGSDTLRGNRSKRSVKRVKLSSDSSDQECLVITKSSTSKSTLRRILRNVLERELTCPICHEIVITTTALQCGHCFCKFCITLWMNRKEKCPLCTAPFRKLIPMRTIDSVIENIFESFMSSRIKSKRILDLETRREEVIRLEEIQSSDSSYFDTSSDSSGSSSSSSDDD